MIERAPTSPKLLTYPEAILYCQFLDYDDHNDWRVPDQHERGEYGVAGWYTADWTNWENTLWYVTPVRDVLPVSNI